MSLITNHFVSLEAGSAYSRSFQCCTTVIPVDIVGESRPSSESRSRRCSTVRTRNPEPSYFPHDLGT